MCDSVLDLESPGRHTSKYVCEGGNFQGGVTETYLVCAWRYAMGWGPRQKYQHHLSLLPVSCFLLPDTVGQAASHCSAQWTVSFVSEPKFIPLVMYFVTAVTKVANTKRGEEVTKTTHNFHLITKLFQSVYRTVIWKNGILVQLHLTCLIDSCLMQGY